MKIQCDVCEKAPAAVICCADEAALCAKCDVEVHAANKLASKHQRLLLQCLSNNLPICDICREKTAFIFCVEDRAVFCKDCDEPIHSAKSLAANHQRYLATGIRVALSSKCDNKGSSKREMPSSKTPHHLTSSPWAVDELLQFSDQYQSSDKQLEFGELEWFTDMNMLGEQVESLAAAEVPISQPASFRPTMNKPRVDEEHFTVPHLG